MITVTRHFAIVATLLCVLHLLPTLANGTKGSTLRGTDDCGAGELGVAVIIGNKSYQHQDIPEMDYAHEDAAAFRRFLTMTNIAGLDVIDMRDATRGQMEEVFGGDDNRGRLWLHVDPNGCSEVVVFYSGHSVPDDGGGSLLPADADPKRPRPRGLSGRPAAGKTERFGCPQGACFLGRWFPSATDHEALR